MSTGSSPTSFLRSSRDLMMLVAASSRTFTLSFPASDHVAKSLPFLLSCLAVYMICWLCLVRLSLINTLAATSAEIKEFSGNCAVRDTPSGSV